MDDLAGLDWSKGSSSQKPANANYTLNPSFSSLKPTPPVSGRASPLNNTPSNPPSKSATPANDSFANLVSWSASPNPSNLSLQEQQKRLAELKLQQQSQQKSQYANGDDAFWNNLGSGRSTPAIESHKNGKPAPADAPQDVDDFLAAFNSSSAQQPKPAPASTPAPAAPAPQSSQFPDDDDDPFGLSEFQQREARRTQTVATLAEDDDDVLGLLGRPVDPSKRKPDLDEEQQPVKPSKNAHPQDRAVAELVDMGFPVDKARQALETTASGIDIQAAVSSLLNAAHQQARESSQNRNTGRNGHTDDVPRRGRGGLKTSRRHVEDNESPVMQRRGQPQAEKDPSQMAAEFGTNFFKTANSLWKQGAKKMQQAVQEFNSDSDTGGQPKWMREVESSSSQAHANGGESAGRQRRRSSTGKRKEQSATDEAMMLEAQRPTPPPRATKRRPEVPVDSSADTSRDHSPAVPSRLRESASPQPAFLRQQQARPSPQPAVSRTVLQRQANEEQAAQAYVSSARRRKPAVHPAAVASEPDLFDTSSKAAPPPGPAISRPAPPKAARIATRPAAPKRTIPSIPPMSLKASHTAREAGNTHFKRGDYSSAHDSYSSSLKHLPSEHPLTLVLLTNHALTALKVGEPKMAIADCDVAITLIGVSKGESETVDFLDGSPAKPMRDYYGKALMRKAEALEQMERWADAAVIWKEAVEGGHGGAASMQGRLRAEKAANPPPKPSAKPAAAIEKKPPPRRPAAKPSGDSAAVSRLRAANAAADKADDEKFALSDSVDLKINNWRNGKQDNLRALLGSLDTVLWPEAGWKKISMADLVLPGKVKVQYMKGIAKVHPDKIPTDATTEQRMISAAVFATLNEAWDKFKTSNGL
ncbi:uncharacterized protein HMPREF1541_08783 [Cyphellophora europaea CBS 101466]|uniref:UBA domain-containing protein n=1 Tax=Cyphellophora europaea (strain CBS 101466) TaxID=1220924 RepID=W2RJI8_CYPE1|nr:uncharacterized protein HMPREF1541_08783 [Cyphellophora europaea CBS 101466]ETN36505.1 hypothetical protein HMPREF1541_08783 [Cyphellophora europaea CBS 101466]